jgi:DNA processing protein
MTHHRSPPQRGRPDWWSPDLPERSVTLALAATHGTLPAVTAARLVRGAMPADLLRPNSPHPDQVAGRLDAIGARLLLPGDPGWPLADTPPDPPCAWLFVVGPVPPGPRASVAVVGGRRASPLRRAAARALAAGLAAAGWCVVSGGAVGVDGAAHTGALDADGRTVVVLGCGLDIAYPRTNAALLARVREGGGTLVSEHPPGALPRPPNFLPRNRLIAALAAAVVIVEAAESSGSLSTARAAGSRGSGRVMAVPGAPWDSGAAGCNALIRDGATLVRGLHDVLDELGPAAASGGLSSESHLPDSDDPLGRARRSGIPVAGAATRAVLAALVDGQPLGPARLAAVTGLSSTTLAAALLELELSGIVQRTPAGVQAVVLPSKASSHAEHPDQAESRPAAGGRR